LRKRCVPNKALLCWVWVIIFI